MFRGTLFLYFIILCLQTLQAQVKIESSAFQKEKEKLRIVELQKKCAECLYDSTQAIIDAEDKKKYIGQSVFILPCDREIKDGEEPLYKGFYTSCEYKTEGLFYKKQIPLPVYKPVTRRNSSTVMETGSDYKSLRGKKFKILGFTTSQDVHYKMHSFSILWDGIDTIYFEYRKNHQYIIEGYVMKQQQLYKNKTFARKFFNLYGYKCPLVK